MSVIEATSGTYRSRVDGTLVLQVEIEPRHASAALALFGMPGQPMALAALKTGAPAAESPPESKKERNPSALGPMAQWLVMRCKEPEFQQWIGAGGERETADWIKFQCGVQSRRDIDGNPHAERYFETQIRKRWLAHQRQPA